MVFKLLTAKSGNFFKFCLSVFLYDLLFNKAGKLKVAESNPIKENVPSSLYLSLLVRVSFLLFLVQILSLSFSQLLLCGVVSSFIILINAEL